MTILKHKPSNRRKVKRAANRPGLSQKWYKIIALHLNSDHATTLNATNSSIILALHRLLPCPDPGQFGDGNGVVRLPAAYDSKQRADDGGHVMFRYGRREASALRLV